MDKAGLETYEEIQKWLVIFKTEADKFYAGRKASGVLARKALDQVSKLKVQWRKEMIHGNGK